MFCTQIHAIITDETVSIMTAIYTINDTPALYYYNNYHERLQDHSHSQLYCAYGRLKKTAFLCLFLPYSECVEFQFLKGPLKQHRVA